MKEFERLAEQRCLDLSNCYANKLDYGQDSGQGRGGYGLPCQGKGVNFKIRTKKGD